MEIKEIKRKFRNSHYSPKFLNSIIHQFFTPKNNDSFITPPDLFEERKTFYWLKYHVVKKTKMLQNILLRNSRDLPINVTELQ